MVFVQRRRKSNLLDILLSALCIEVIFYCALVYSANISQVRSNKYYLSKQWLMVLNYDGEYIQFRQQTAKVWDGQVLSKLNNVGSVYFNGCNLQACMFFFFLGALFFAFYLSFQRIFQVVGILNAEISFCFSIWSQINYLFKLCLKKCNY